MHGEPLRGVAAKADSPLLDVGCDTFHMSVLDSLVRTILSQNTTDITSQRAFDALKLAFPDWALVLASPPGPIEDAIRAGGLAEVKTQRIQNILSILVSERGSCTLEHLRDLATEDVKTQLTRFKGVGPKTVACVLMFCLRRPEFPVDTHVWEMAKQLGWVPPTASRNDTYDHLNKLVPDEIKYDLHVLMVQHGKVCPACAKAPKAGRKGVAPDCPLAPLKRGARGLGAAVKDEQELAGGSGSSAKAHVKEEADEGLGVKIEETEEGRGVKVEEEVLMVGLVVKEEEGEGAGGSGCGVKAEGQVHIKAEPQGLLTVKVELGSDMVGLVAVKEERASGQSGAQAGPAGARSQCGGVKRPPPAAVKEEEAEEAAAPSGRVLSPAAGPARRARPAARGVVAVAAAVVKVEPATLGGGAEGSCGGSAADGGGSSGGQELLPVEAQKKRTRRR